MEEVTLLIEAEPFVAKKDALCEHSDYFRAMFSGSYVEADREEIQIDIVDAKSMSMILQYVDNKLNFLDYSLNDISVLGDAALYLQMTGLFEDIEKSLDNNLSESNCIETMEIAEKFSLLKLKQFSAAYALFSFKSMKPEFIPYLERLYWYLSHPNLYTESELDVFKFGYEWIKQNEVDALITILCCLDFKKLKTDDLIEIKLIIKDYKNAAAVNIINCLHELLNGGNELSAIIIESMRDHICEVYSENVYKDVFSLVTQSTTRMELKIIPTLSFWEKENDEKGNTVRNSYALYAYTNGFKKWLQMPFSNVFGWKIVAWSTTKLVVVNGRYTGENKVKYMRDVLVYDVLRQTWIKHDVELPCRESGGVAIRGDSLFIVGGKGVNGQILDTAIVYDLKLKTYRDLAKLPDELKVDEIPILCVHEDLLYGVGHRDIYRYDDDTSSWMNVIKPRVRVNSKTSCMTSHGGYIYCTQRYMPYLLRCRPDVDKNFEQVTYFNSPAIALCSIGNRLLAFTNMIEMMKTTHQETLSVEEYLQHEDVEFPKILWEEILYDKYEANGGCCLVFQGVQTLCPEVPEFHKRCLDNIS